jgi:hypothetical protein
MNDPPAPHLSWEVEAPAEAAPELWKDFEADPVAPGAGVGGDTVLDRPLVVPPPGP